MPVAFTSAGYGGAVTQESWADLASKMGHTYAIDGKDSWAVTSAVGDRAIAISPGKGFGHGVVDSTDDAETMFIPAVASGTLRYDMIVVRRDWSTKATTFAIVTGSNARLLPIRENNPGFTDEQPLALVRVNAGSTVIAEIIDLRVWATNGGMLGRDALCRKYLEQLGTRIKIAGETWSYEHISPTVTDWVNEDGNGPWVDLEFLPGWQRVGGGIQPRARTVGRGHFVHIQVEAVYPPGQPVEGWIICRLPAGMRTKEGTFIPGTTDLYRRSGVYLVHDDAIRIGPYPLGNVAQCNGIVPLK